MTMIAMKDDTKNLKLLRELFEEQRLALLYLKFDVEATRRERDYWRKQAEDK